ncbi:MAG TPA: hypothetical protein PKU97_16825 [Kofleriaceae bacterium]|nr:hypothetical protein [Kofleriaceae bacterium]
MPSAALALRAAELRPLELWTFAGLGAAGLTQAPGSTSAQLALTLHGGAGILVHKAGLSFELSALLTLMEPAGVQEAWPSVRVGISSTFDR